MQVYMGQRKDLIALPVEYSELGQTFKRDVLVKIVNDFYLLS